MVLDKIPNTKIFTQRDVRETPASTATATAVGLTGESYVLVGAGGADLTAERTLVAGEGLDLSDGGAGTTITISGENATTTNKGIASFHNDDFQVTSGVVTLDADIAKTFDGDTGTATTAVHNIDILGGTGITTLGANNDITITNSGVTSAVSGTGVDVSGATGAVTFSSNDGEIDHNSLNNLVANEHLDWTQDQGATNIHAGNVPSAGTMNDFDLDGDTGTPETITNGDTLMIAGGEGINTAVGATDTVTISGELATTTNKGIASFADADFQVSSGVVSLDGDVISTIDGDSGTATGSSHNIDILGGTGITTAGSSNDITVGLTNKTSYWSITGEAFHAASPDVDDINFGGAGEVTAAGSSIFLMCPVNLPNGAVVTSVIVYGNGGATAETWSLKRGDFAAGQDTMATANIGTADSSISNATVDNSTYGYFLFTSGIDSGDTIYGARITYTTDYD